MALRKPILIGGHNSGNYRNSGDDGGNNRRDLQQLQPRPPPTDAKGRMRLFQAYVAVLAFAGDQLTSVQAEELRRRLGVSRQQRTFSLEDSELSARDALIIVQPFVSQRFHQLLLSAVDQGLAMQVNAIQRKAQAQRQAAKAAERLIEQMSEQMSERLSMERLALHDETMESAAAAAAAAPAAASDRVLRSSSRKSGGGGGGGSKKSGNSNKSGKSSSQGSLNSAARAALASDVRSPRSNSNVSNDHYALTSSRRVGAREFDVEGKVARAQVRRTYEVSAAAARTYDLTNENEEEEEQDEWEQEEQEEQQEVQEEPPSRREIAMAAARRAQEHTEHLEAELAQAEIQAALFRAQVVASRAAAAAAALAVLTPASASASRWRTSWNHNQHPNQHQHQQQHRTHARVRYPDEAREEEEEEEAQEEEDEEGRRFDKPTTPAPYRRH